MAIIRDVWYRRPWKQSAIDISRSTYIQTGNSQREAKDTKGTFKLIDENKLTTPCLKDKDKRTNNRPQ